MIHVGVDLHQRFCYVTVVEASRKDTAAAFVGKRGGGATAVGAKLAGSGPGGGGSVQLLAGVSEKPGWGGGTNGAGASGAGEGDCLGQAEERPSGFGNAGAFIAL